MPVYGKKVSPQEMIGKSFHRVEHKIDRGEHQMWFRNLEANYIFFEPVYCCDAVIIDYFDPPEKLLGMTVKSIEFDNGLYTFNFCDGTYWTMKWRSNKNKPVAMVKLSKQVVK